MIQISSFSPLDNLARRSWIFDEEYIIARTKSLTVEIEDEIKYEDIRVIQAGRAASLRGVWGAFVLLAVLATTHWLLGAYCQNPPILQSIEKVGFFLGLVIMIPSFRKIEMYSFRDLDREPLMYIPVRAKDRQAMAQAIAHVRQRTTLFSERGPNDPLPADQPIFELTDLNIPDFLSRSTTRFYNDRLLDVEKSLVEETVTEIMYSELSGKTRVIRVECEMGLRMELLAHICLHDGLFNHNLLPTAGTWKHNVLHLISGQSVSAYSNVSHEICETGPAGILQPP